MQFGTIVDMALVYCFNVIIIGTAIFVLLRVMEKTVDIALKLQQYEKNRRDR